MKDENEEIINNEDELIKETAPEDGDLDYEVDEEIEEESGLTDKIKALRQELKEVKKEKAEFLTNWQRDRADFVNYKAKDSERLKEFIDKERKKFINNLLPVLDSYDLAFANKEAWEKVEKNWRVGVEYIHAKLLEVIRDYNVSEIGKEGEVFNPEIHEPYETSETENESEDNTIDRVIQKGYKMGDTVIRPAKVVVKTLKK